VWWVSGKSGGGKLEVIGMETKVKTQKVPLWELGRNKQIHGMKSKVE
jgi:hypothetical protein